MNVKMVLNMLVVVSVLSVRAELTPDVRSYIENYPFIIMTETCKKMTNPITHGMFPGAVPFGTFYHGKRLQDYRDRLVVNPNNDTVMSMAWVNVTGDAKYLLVIPPIPLKGYFSVEILDLWTDVLKVISARTVTDRKEQRFILIGPAGHVKKGEEAFTIKSSTDVVWILMRISSDGSKDMNAIRELQQKVQLIPLIPAPAASNETACALDETQKKLAQNTAIKKQAEAEMERIFFKACATTNGWNGTLNYKQIDEKIRRAIIAYDGLGALPASEAVYFATDVDDEGKQLVGSNVYTLHFDKVPPADAFWSVSAYDKKTALFEQNSFNRYSVGSSTHGLLINPDGSIDIIMHHDEPSQKIANHMNWLPLPAQECFVVLRLYHPRAEVLDGNYLPPRVKRMK